MPPTGPPIVPYTGRAMGGALQGGGMPKHGLK